MEYIAGLLDEIGIGGERVRMVNASSAEGAQFAQHCEEMTETIRELGPSPLGPTGTDTPADPDPNGDGDSDEEAAA